jgi:transposase
MLAAGERLVRVPPKMMAHSRDSARTYGKSDPIDALAVARAALREPGLPTAYLDEPARELRLLVDHREDLIAERTRHINRLRWHLHDIDPSWAPKDRALTTMKHLRQTQERLAELDTVVARIAKDQVERIRALTIEINALEAELDERTTSVAPASAPGPRRRRTQRSQVHRRSGRDRPVPVTSRLRPTQRNSADTRLVRQHRAAPAQPCGQPTTQRSDPPSRPHPGSFMGRRPRLPRPPAESRCHPQGSHPLP